MLQQLALQAFAGADFVEEMSAVRD